MEKSEKWFGSMVLCLTVGWILFTLIHTVCDVAIEFVIALLLKVPVLKILPSWVISWWPSFPAVFSSFSASETAFRITSGVMPQVAKERWKAVGWAYVILGAYLIIMFSISLWLSFSNANNPLTFVPIIIAGIQFLAMGIMAIKSAENE